VEALYRKSGISTVLISTVNNRYCNHTEQHIITIWHLNLQRRLFLSGRACEKEANVHRWKPCDPCLFELQATQGSSSETLSCLLKTPIQAFADLWHHQGMRKHYSTASKVVLLYTLFCNYILSFSLHSKLLTNFPGSLSNNNISRYRARLLLAVVAILSLPFLSLNNVWSQNWVKDDISTYVPRGSSMSTQKLTWTAFAKNF